jgi:uncharacterized protein
MKAFQMARPRQRHQYDYHIDEHGSWFCEGNPVADEQLFQVLSRSLFQRDGRYFIRCEGEVHPVQAADAPLWVRYIFPQKDPDDRLSRVEIELYDGRREPLAPDSLTVAHGYAIYCLATPARLRTRLGKVAYYELAQYLHEDQETGIFYLIVGGTRFELKPEPT